MKFRHIPIAVGLLAIHGLLKAFGFAKTRRVLHRVPPRRRTIDVSALSADVIRVSHSRPIASLGVDCVAESLAIEFALRFSGLAPDLRLGVDPVARDNAHAWVELDGKPVNEQDDVRQRWATFEGELPTGLSGRDSAS